MRVAIVCLLTLVRRISELIRVGSMTNLLDAEVRHELGSVLARRGTNGGIYVLTRFATCVVVLAHFQIRTMFADEGMMQHARLAICGITAHVKLECQHVLGTLITRNGWHGFMHLACQFVHDGTVWGDMVVYGAGYVTLYQHLISQPPSYPSSTGQSS